MESPFGAEPKVTVGEGTVSLLVVVPLAGVAFLAGSEYRKTPFDPTFEEVSKEQGIGSDLLRAIARHESNFNPAAISPANRDGSRDYGLMQINEATARHFGYRPQDLITTKIKPNLTIVKRSLVVASKLLRAVRSELAEKANLYTMVAAYNAGSPAIRRRGIFNIAYVQSVLFHHQMYILGGVLGDRTKP